MPPTAFCRELGIAAVKFYEYAKKQRFPGDLRTGMERLLADYTAAAEPADAEPVARTP